MVCHCAYESFVLMNHQLSHPKEIYSLYAKKPSNPEDELFIALVKKATQSYGKKNYKAAVNYFEKALLLKPTNTNIHWNLAGLHRKLNQLDQALSHLNDYLKDRTLSKKRRKKAKDRRQQVLSEMKERYLSPNGSFDTHAKNPKPQGRNTQVTPPPISSNDSSNPNSSNQLEEYSDHSEDQHDRLWIIWGVTGLSLSALSVGLHVYADMTWQSRPIGGGKTAMSLQDNATTVSWIADGFLLAGISTLGISLYYFLQNSANTTMMTMTTKTHDPMVRLGMNTLLLDQSESQRSASYRLPSQLMPQLMPQLIPQHAPQLTSISVHKSSLPDLPQLMIDPQRAMLFWCHQF